MVTTISPVLLCAASLTVLLHTSTMTLTLRLSLVILWASYACGTQRYSTGQRSYGHYYYGHAQTYNYPTYNHHYPTYQKPLCTAQTPCYEQAVTFTNDAIPGPSVPPDPKALIYHYTRAGLDRYAIIEEGKRAAQYFHHQYGVDVGYLPDEAYLAPNITLPNGVRFSIITPGVVGTMNVATRGPSVQFINAPASVAGWHLAFLADYYSNGAIKGHIPAGSASVFNSYVFDTCPDESPYNPCRSILSKKRKGRVFIRVQARTFGTPGGIDCLLLHEHWGDGHVIGSSVTTPDGVAHTRAILTFPRSCDDSVKCFARSLH